VQISFLRYQSEAITHQVCLALDLAALFWFHARLWMAGRKRRLIPGAAFWRRTALNGVLPLLVIAFAVIYAGVPSAERKTVGRVLRIWPDATSLRHTSAGVRRPPHGPR
jgi:hypothetical protein